MQLTLKTAASFHSEQWLFHCIDSKDTFYPRLLVPVCFSMSAHTAFYFMSFPRRVTTSLQTSALKSTATWCNYWNRLFSPQTSLCTLSKSSFIISHKLRYYKSCKKKKKSQIKETYPWIEEDSNFDFWNLFLCLACIIDGPDVKEENQVLWECFVWRIQMDRWRTQRSFQVSAFLFQWKYTEPKSHRRHKLVCCRQVHADDGVRSGRCHSSLENF